MSSAYYVSEQWFMNNLDERTLSELVADLVQRFGVKV